MPSYKGSTFFEVLTAIINEVSENGYQSDEQIAAMSEMLEQAARRAFKSIEEVERMVRDGMAAIFHRQVINGGVLRLNPGVKAYTIERVKPELRAELSRRISASIQLIKLDREQSIKKAEQRFIGWATSIPAGGMPKTGNSKLDKVDKKREIRKSLSSLPYAERRVIIDQSHKLVAAINTTVAVNGGAIGAIWQSHKGQPGYDGRPIHNARDGQFFLVRDSWADKAGYVKPGPEGYTDAIDQPGEWVFCRCHWQYVYSLRSIPPECLTEKGKEALAEARRKAAA